MLLRSKTGFDAPIVLAITIVVTHAVKVQCPAQTRCEESRVPCCQCCVFSDSGEVYSGSLMCMYTVHVQCTVNECVPCGVWSVGSVSQAIIGTITAAYSAQYMSVWSVSDRCLQSTTVYGRSVCVVGHPVVSDTRQDAIVCRLCHLLHVTLCKPVQCTTPQ